MSLLSNLSEEHHGYFFLVVIFFLVIYYQYVIVDVPNSDQDSSVMLSIEQPTVSARAPEKVYENVFQPQRGDFFRVGMVIKSQDKHVMEVYVRSVFDERTKVGEINSDPSMNGQYKELIFAVPSGRYQDIILHLKDNTSEPGVWSDSNVYVNSFFVSRVNVREQSQVRGLLPTVFGIPNVRTKTFSIAVENESVALKSLKMIFQAEDDFIDTMSLSGDILDRNDARYLLSLSHFDNETKEIGQKIHDSTFTSRSFANFRKIDGGSYDVPFLSSLERGQWYILVFSRSDDEDRVIPFTFSQKKEVGIGSYPSQERSIGLNFSSHHRFEESGDVVLDYASLQDLGETFSYQSSLQGKESDFKNLFARSNSIRFNQKDGLVAGDKKHSEYFVYKFDTLYPFEIFSLRAEQFGSSQTAIRLEYSFDNLSWEDVAFQQEEDQPQKFFLSVPGNGTNKVVFVRVSYIGQEKKTGSFALRGLSVNAVVPKQ